MIYPWTALTSWLSNRARQHTYDVRRILFERILERMRAGPDHVSIKFGQDILLKGSKITEVLVDVSAGTLYITIESEYQGQVGQHSYSLFMTGDLLRIGLLLSDGLDLAPLVDWHNEMQSVWPGCPPEIVDRQGTTLYEWTFLLPDIYDSYPTQERYILGIRHMHARMLRIIHDYRKSVVAGDA